MNKEQKEITQASLDNEKKVLADLKKTYKKAEDDINAKIEALMLRAQTDTVNLQSIVYQVNYQQALKKQISGILDDLNGEQFSTISEYLAKSYEDGFIGTLYDLQGQGVPLIFPIDQQQVKQAIVHNTKLSKSLYAKLGEDTALLNKRIQSELSRGISQNYPYGKIAQNISNQTTIGYNKASRIARTEGHRISQEATYDAQLKAKEAGADVVKQWDSTLDKRTRNAHRTLDGQIRELEEPFEVNGQTAMYPGGFGIPSQDIHCRCVILQRARWALEDDELKVKDEFEPLSKTDRTNANMLYNYADFKVEKQPDGSIQCHEGTQAIKGFVDTLDDEIKDKVTYFEWDESKWGEVQARLKSVDIPDFGDENISNLIEDIKDGSVNGHSFAIYDGKYYIDPNLNSLEVPQDKINKFDDWFKQVYDGKSNDVSDVFTKWDNESRQLIEIKAKDYNDFKEKYYKTLDIQVEKAKNDKKVQSFLQELEDGKINTKVRPQKQSEHIVGTKERTRRVESDKANGKTPSSEFYEGTDVEKLISEKAGTGDIEFRSNRKYPVEFVDNDKPIGRVWDESLGKYVDTNRFEIVYSNNGRHGYPVKPKKE